MKCPFRYRKSRRRYRSYRFGVAPDFMDFVEEAENLRMAIEYERETAFNKAHPTCWNKFLYRIGMRPALPPQQRGTANE